MPVTQSEIAREAGVSQTIVSDVLQGRLRGRVRPETRQRILQTASQLGYRPNAMAQALRSRQSKQIVYLTTVSETHEFPALRESDISGVARVLRANGYRLLIDVASSQETEVSMLTEMVASGICDGGVMRAYRGGTALWEALKSVADPLVVIGQCPDPDITSIAHDVPAIMSTAVRCLAERGHKRIGLIVDPTHDLYHELIVDIWNDFAREMNFDARRWFGESQNRGQGQSLVTSWLGQAEHATAFISLDTGSALGANTAIREHGDRLAQDFDLLVIGENRTAWLYEGGTLLYGLDVEMVGARAASELLNMLDGGANAGPIRLKAELTQI